MAGKSSTTKALTAKQAFHVINKISRDPSGTFSQEVQALLQQYGSDEVAKAFEQFKTRLANINAANKNGDTTEETEKPRSPVDQERADELEQIVCFIQKTLTHAPSPRWIKGAAEDAGYSFKHGIPLGNWMRPCQSSIESQAMIIAAMKFGESLLKMNNDETPIDWSPTTECNEMYYRDHLQKSRDKVKAYLNGIDDMGKSENGAVRTDPIDATDRDEKVRLGHAETREETQLGIQSEAPSERSSRKRKAVESLESPQHGLRRSKRAIRNEAS